jgi:hypothetical protein
MVERQPSAVGSNRGFIVGVGRAGAGPLGLQHHHVMVRGISQKASGSARSNDNDGSAGAQPAGVIYLPDRPASVPPADALVTPEWRDAART